MARVVATPGTVEAREGFPCLVAGATAYGAVEGLPEPREGTALVVSGLVLGRCPGRADGAVREDGRIVAVTRLIAAPTE